MTNRPIRVLFLCTHNSARSQMAEALLRWLGGEQFDVFSAGSEPGQVHPLAIRAMADVGLDISGARSKHLDEYLGETFDYVITVCDRANESCPIFPGDPERIHWSFPDPSQATGTDEERLHAFRHIRAEVAQRLRLWLPVARSQQVSAQGAWFATPPNELSDESQREMAITSDQSPWLVGPDVPVPIDRLVLRDT